MTLWAAVIIAIALGIAIGTGVLTWLASRQSATAVIAGAGAFAAAVPFLKKNIG